MRKEKTKKKLLDWMMSEEYSKPNLKKKLNIEKHGIIGGLDLPDGRGLKEEVIENSQKCSLCSNNGIGGAPKNKLAAARRGRRTALPSVTTTLGKIVLS